MVNSVEILSRKRTRLETHALQSSRVFSILRVHQHPPALLSWYAKLAGNGGPPCAQNTQRWATPLVPRFRGTETPRATSMKKPQKSFIKTYQY